MMGLNLLIASVAICAVSSILGQIGLRRLQYTAPFPLKEAWAVGLPCAWTGLVIAITAGEGGSVQTERVVGLGLLSTLLLMAALIDAKTAWAPTEIILPICILAPTSLLSSHVSFNGLIWPLGDGLICRCLGILADPKLAGCPHSSPRADATALSLPMIVLKESESIALYFFLLAVFLILIRRFGHRVLFQDEDLEIARAQRQAESLVGEETRSAARHRRRPLNFHEMDIPDGSILNSVHTNNTAEVIGPRKVKFGDEPMSLTRATKIDLAIDYQVPPIPNWEFKGE